MIVAHDSEGFEAGQRDELDVVRNFIKRRSKAKDINDRLHVVWCVQTIYVGHQTMTSNPPFCIFLPQSGTASK
jgi:hypothetical protein